MCRFKVGLQATCSRHPLADQVWALKQPAPLPPTTVVLRPFCLKIGMSISPRASQSAREAEVMSHQSMPTLHLESHTRFAKPTVQCFQCWGGRPSFYYWSISLLPWKESRKGGIMTTSKKTPRNVAGFKRRSMQQFN